MEKVEKKSKKLQRAKRTKWLDSLAHLEVKAKHISGEHLRLP